MKKSSFYLRVALVLVVVAALGAASWWYITKTNRDPKLRKITIAQAGDFFLYAPLYIAVDAQLFRRKGLDVTIVSTGGDEKTWAAVIGGNAKFGVADPTFVAISTSRGEPGRVIASIVNGVPFWGVTNKSQINIRSPKDLAGYTVGTFPSPSTAFALQRKMFVDAGLEPKIREGAFGTLLSMLNANQVDIALELEPNVSQAVASGSRVVYSMRDMYGDFAITGLTTTPNILSGDHELAADVVCALQLSLDFIRENPEQTLAFLSQRFPEVNKDVAGEALKRVTAESIIPSTVKVSPAAWEKAIDLRRDLGEIQQVLTINNYIDNSLAERAETGCRM